MHLFFLQEDPVLDDIVYVSPKPSGNVHFAEHFDDLTQFNKRWILSEAKKDDIDDDIAKYDGMLLVILHILVMWNIFLKKWVYKFEL